MFSNRVIIGTSCFNLNIFMLCFRLFSFFQMPLCLDVNTQSVFKVLHIGVLVFPIYYLLPRRKFCLSICVFKILHICRKYHLCFQNIPLFMYLCFQCILFFLAALVSWRKYYCRSTRLRPSSQSSINHKCNKSVTFFCIWVSKQSQIFILLFLLYEGSFAFWKMFHTDIYLQLWWILRDFYIIFHLFMSTGSNMSSFMFFQQI